VDRKEILTELGEVLDEADERRRAGASLLQGALDVDPLRAGARDARAHLRASGELNELVEVLNARRRASRTPEQVAATKLRAAGSTRRRSAARKAAQVYREVLEVDGSNLLAMRGLERVYGSCSSGPSW
jgi:hypothetical protein